MGVKGGRDIVPIHEQQNKNGVAVNSNNRPKLSWPKFFKERSARAQ
jgi:hypothetical protein